MQISTSVGVVQAMIVSSVPYPRGAPGLSSRCLSMRQNKSKVTLRQGVLRGIFHRRRAGALAGQIVTLSFQAGRSRAMCEAPRPEIGRGDGARSEKSFEEEGPG